MKKIMVFTAIVGLMAYVLFDRTFSVSSAKRTESVSEGEMTAVEQETELEKEYVMTSLTVGDRTINLKDCTYGAVVELMKLHDLKVTGVEEDIKNQVDPGKKIRTNFFKAAIDAYNAAEEIQNIDNCRVSLLLVYPEAYEMISFLGGRVNGKSTQNQIEKVLTELGLEFQIKEYGARASAKRLTLTVTKSLSAGQKIELEFEFQAERGVLEAVLIRIPPLLSQKAADVAADPDAKKMTTSEIKMRIGTGEREP